MFKRFWAVFRARNLEFFRDRSTLAWNIAFPLLILVGFAFIFDGDGKTEYKVGVMTEANSAQPASAFLSLKYVQYVEYSDAELALSKLQQHGLDLLIAPAQEQYWLNSSSPKGYFLEKLLLASEPAYQKHALEGREIRYLDWVVPGILGMNMMFSCLFGVGYVIVRYRKSSVLKRLQATPLSAMEFLLAQVMSRLFIVVTLTSLIFLACDQMFDFYMLGSYLNLLVITLLGAMCLISLGLLMASRSHSEELTGGVLNMVSWPMMILSGVWFSLEGAPEAIRQFALLLPLTHLVEGARTIMTTGAGLWEIKHHVFALVVMTLVFLLLGVKLFRWQGEGR